MIINENSFDQVSSENFQVDKLSFESLKDTNFFLET